MAPLGYDRSTGYLIRGAFDLDGWEFRPRPHSKHEPFGVGCVARPNADKWSTNTQRIYDRIAYQHHMAARERCRQGYNTNVKTGQRHRAFPRFIEVSGAGPVSLPTYGETLAETQVT